MTLDASRLIVPPAPRVPSAARWRMAGTSRRNVIAAVLDVFSFTLLIPFLNALFEQRS